MVFRSRLMVTFCFVLSVYHVLHVQSSMGCVGANPEYGHPNGPSPTLTHPSHKMAGSVKTPLRVHGKSRTAGAGRPWGDKAKTNRAAFCAKHQRSRLVRCQQKQRTRLRSWRRAECAHRNRSAAGRQEVEVTRLKVAEAGARHTLNRGVRNDI